MNITNNLLSEKGICPKNWFISVPNLYGANCLYDIVGSKKATFPGDSSQRVIWETGSNKPGSLAGAVTTVGRTVPSSIDIGISLGTKFTVSFWVKASSYVTGSNMLNTENLYIGMHTTGVIRFTNTTSTLGTTVLTPNKWYHVCIVSTVTIGESHLIYLNGKLEISHIGTHSSSQTLRSMGNYQNLTGTSGTQLYGSFDDIAIFNNILSKESVYDLYKSGFNRSRFSFNAFANPLTAFYAMYGGQF